MIVFPEFVRIIILIVQAIVAGILIPNPYRTPSRRIGSQFVKYGSYLRAARFWESGTLEFLSVHGEYIFSGHACSKMPALPPPRRSCRGILISNRIISQRLDTFIPGREEGPGIFSSSFRKGRHVISRFPEKPEVLYAAVFLPSQMNNAYVSCCPCIHGELYPNFTLLFKVKSLSIYLDRHPDNP